LNFSFSAGSDESNSKNFFFEFYFFIYSIEFFQALHFAHPLLPIVGNRRVVGSISNTGTGG